MPVCLPCMAAAASAGPPGWALMAVAGGAAYIYKRTRTSGLSSNIVEANKVAASVLGNVPMPLRHVALAIGLFESGYGLEGSWKNADDTPSYNWGALVGAGTAGSIDHGDRDKDNNAYTTKFQAFNSMREGFQAFMRVFTRDEALGPAERGDARGVATALYKHGYFVGTKGSDEDRIAAYSNAIVASAAQIAGVLGEPVDVHDHVAPSAGKTAVIASAAAGAAYLLGAPIAVVVGAPLAVLWYQMRKAA